MYKYNQDFDYESDEWSADEDDGEENVKVKAFKVKSSFSSKLSSACLKIADVLLKDNVDVNAASSTGETALMIALRQVNHCGSKFSWCL